MTRHRSHRFWLRRPPATRCMNCGVDLDQTRQRFEVTPLVWAEAGSLAELTECVGCLEATLGRPLTGRDFMPGSAINYRAALGGPSDEAEVLCARLDGPGWDAVRTAHAFRFAPRPGD